MKRTKSDLPESQDEIIAELRRVKIEHAREFEFDIHAICSDLRSEQERSKAKSTTLPPKPARKRPAAA